MFRYFAFFWNDADPTACATAQCLIHKCRAQSSSWQPVMTEHGATVLCAGATNTQASRVLTGPDNKILGVILGDLFRLSRDGTRTVARSARCDQLSREEGERILRSGGRDLISSYWGNYVAFLRDLERRTRWVLRAPAATLPCLHVALEGIDLYFSRAEDCAALDATSFSINWTLVARTLMGPLSSPQTGLNEIREILPGFCEENRRTPTIRHRYWDPVKIAQTDSIADFESAARTLHDVTRSCVHAWAERTPQILHALSGGLDSSIVLGCLQSAPTHPDITCLTHFAEGPDSDERDFAHAAVRQANCHHIERQQLAEIDLRGVLHGIRFETSPGMRIPEIDRVEPDIALEIGAQAIYKGHGGDELFCRHHTQFYVADFLRDHGLHPTPLPLLLHSAVTEGETLWTIFAGALRDAFIPRRWNMARIFSRDQEDQSLIHPEITTALLADRSLDPPYTHSTRNCPPGKLWQINLITGRRFHYLPSAREGDPRQISPLLSQPLIETCLRIPTYLQMKDRRERAVARAAFAHEVPQEIINRRWKGGAEHLAWKMLRTNLPFIRELLLDGHLAHAHILDRPRLEALLTASPYSILKATVPVFHLVGAEAWLQAWSGRGVNNLP